MNCVLCKRNKVKVFICDECEKLPVKVKDEKLNKIAQDLGLAMMEAEKTHKDNWSIQWVEDRRFQKVSDKKEKKGE